MPTVVPALLLATALAFVATSGGARPQPLVVSVAASLADVMSELARRHEQATGQAVRLNVAGSNFIARQIVEGARVDAFISADDAQMDVAEKAGRLVPGTRVPLLTNQLVVVGRPGGTLRVTGASVLATPAVGRVALGNPESVPAGVYARQWLERQAVWRDVSPKVVPAMTVRAALAAARAGRVDAAIVYATYRVPTADAPAIVYPVAVVRGANEAAARAFVTYLQSVEAGAVFRAAGFGLAAR
jgi:molybdate transport system substrate-binding protein